MATPTPSSAASAPSPSGSVSHTPINEPTPIDADTAAASISSDEETTPFESLDPLKGGVICSIKPFLLQISDTRVLATQAPKDLRTSCLSDQTNTVGRLVRMLQL
ncbi:hypothetical protein IFM89_005584 [Coptis chinensis]|uniref:Uncharacterized protein n=1 Tax=Coptis chinensis TaxID=261450 RepID=A0A835LZA8_9MAGN|nr:hypothetical protein IFM89_005584 [Coptis chinensis]